MSKVISTTGDTDFVWTEETILNGVLEFPNQVEPTTLVVYYQGEAGYASFVAGASLVGEQQPVCKIFSKLHQVEPMNSLPLPTFPEWRLYEMRNLDGRRYFILRISHAYTPSPEQTKAWLYNYPVMRDIIIECSKRGVDELVYLTSHVMQNFIFDDQPQIPPNELIVYNYQEPEDEALYLTNGEVIDDLQLIVPSPTWIMCSLFNSFCTNPIRGVWLVLCGNDNTTYLNISEADRLLDYMYDVHGLEYDTVYYSEMMEALKLAEHIGGNQQ